MTSTTRWLIFSTLSLILFACVSLPPLPPLPQGAPPDFPADFYQQAARLGNRVDRVDSSRSLITVYAYRSGPLAASGHDHVVASHDVHGYILVSKTPAESRADVYFPVGTLRVDEAQLRTEAGFTTQVPAQDAENTQQNMLRSVLEAPDFPHIVLHISGFQGNPPQVTLSAQLTVHGQTRDIAIPAHLQLEAKNIEVDGEFSIRQTDFGMTPYSILGGALAVKDELQIRFKLYAVT